MAINYNDERFTNLKNEEAAAKNESNSTYDSLINESGQYYDNLINQSKEWADKQADIQNQQTEFAIDKIEQQKQKAEKDYTKEQKGAYQDYMKQSNAYGSNMQAMGQQGLSGSGWSETIQSGFYNTYQNRYAQARESYNEIIMNYDNNIKEAQLQNSATLANIYAQAAKEQLELALQSFTVIKDLKLNKLNQSIALDNEYNNRWRQVESQINTENALAEQIRQYNASLAEQKRQADMDNAYRNSALALEREKFNYQKAQDAANQTVLNGNGNGSGSGEETLKGNDKKKEETNLNNNKKTETKKSSTVKLSNGKTGYTSATQAYSKAGGKTPYSAEALLSKGIVKKTTYKGTTYYYYVGESKKNNTKSSGSNNKGFSSVTYDRLR